MTKAQIKYVRGLLHRQGLTEEKDAVVLEYTGGRTTHLTEMRYGETNALIKFLAGPSKKDAMTGKILSMAHEMGWELPGGKVDVQRVNAWCMKYTSCKQPLDKIPMNELPKVVTVFERVYMSFMKGI
ncbi:hypothetical protein [Cyclobacterium marinum]|uniref:Uncharacterized protein n=1 Tax=Cyclobacterium marinum (strain ATCC 25205 / DSM 745 / LMG 13164 / NCIMB 1802) TaxID=880070 RepID=G0IZ89_CYCMS|nr:hypothetical protein [Cyclobacterium marinum]AEL23868.1 hypothetical protein Cycma_0083 [Cyclobacterium marinum DSM 745]